MGARYKSIAFDLDGTLVDSWRDIHAAMADLLAEHGLPPLPAERFRKAIGNGMYDMLADAFAEGGQPLDAAGRAALGDRVGVLYRARNNKDSHLFPGVQDTLQQLQDAGYCLCICTNKSLANAIPVVEHFGLQKYMDFIVAGDSLVERKPSGMPLEYLMEQSGATPKSMLMVGDNITDCTAARAAGCDMALMSYGYRRQAIDALPHDWLCHSIQELLDFLPLDTQSGTI